MGGYTTKFIPAHGIILIIGISAPLYFPNRKTPHEKLIILKCALGKQDKRLLDFKWWHYVLQRAQREISGKHCWTVFFCILHWYWTYNQVFVLNRCPVYKHKCAKPVSRWRENHGTGRLNRCEGIANQLLISLFLKELTINYWSQYAGCFLHWASPKKLKYGKPRWGTYVDVDRPRYT